MKTYGICLVVLTVVMLLAQCALCALIWTEEKITPAGAQPGLPKVWGDRVYYSDSRTGIRQVYVWDRVGGERSLIGGPTNAAVAGVYGDTLLLSRYTNGQYDLYLWDPVSGERPVTTAAGNQSAASIYGNTVVFVDSSTGVAQVHVWDPMNGDRAIAPSSNNQIAPKIYGNTVVWEEGYQDEFTDYYMPSVYMWDPVNGKRLIGNGMESPAIYGDKITMFMPDPDRYSSGSFLYQYSTSTGLTGKYATVSGRSISMASTWGDMVRISAMSTGCFGGCRPGVSVMPTT